MAIWGSCGILAMTSTVVPAGSGLLADRCSIGIVSARCGRCRGPGTRPGGRPGVWVRVGGCMFVNARDSIGSRCGGRGSLAMSRFEASISISP